MSRPEMYPWSMLTEVGDYFVVPHSFKSDLYLKQLVTFRNNRYKGIVRYASADIGEKTIIILAQVGDEVPPYEFTDDNGIMCSSSRKKVLADIKSGTSELGKRPEVARRTQAQRVAAMTTAEREANLPWWYDPRTGTLLVNTKVVHEEDSILWHQGKLNPGPEGKYPDRYNLGEDLFRKSREEVMAEEDEDEDEWAGLPANMESESE